MPQIPTVNPPNGFRNSGVAIQPSTPPQRSPNDIVIPPPTGGIQAFGLFTKLATGFLQAGVISNLSLGEEQQLQSSITDNNVTNLISNTRSLANGNIKIFSPDAVPDGKGGYKPSSSNYWNGMLSSMTNAPVMSAITFYGTTYTALNGQQITIPQITFEMCLIKMKKGKNIEKTNITGRDTGSVKEYIGAKDWDITLNVIVTAAQNVSEGMQSFYQIGKYPEENMEKIDLLLNAPISIQVYCPYLNNRGINYLVIDDGVEISQSEGDYEAQHISIPCCSDNPLIIQVAQ